MPIGPERRHPPSLDRVVDHSRDRLPHFHDRDRLPGLPIRHIDRNASGRRVEIDDAHPRHRLPAAGALPDRAMELRPDRLR